MPCPVIQYIVAGDDFLANAHLKALLVKLVDEGTRDFNFHKFSATEVSVGRIVDVVKTMPMMANSRTVVVTEADKLKKDDLAVFEAHLKSPPEFTHLIFVGEKCDKRTVFFKTLSQVGEVVEFKQPYPRQVPHLVLEQASRLGLTLGPGCVEALVESVGVNLRSHVSELEKLSLLALPGKTITREHVRALVSDGIVENVFAITGLIGLRDLKGALSLFSRMCEQGEKVMGIVAMVIGHFRKLLLLCEACEQRVSEHDMASVAGVPPFFLKDYLVQLKHFDRPVLIKIYKRIMKLSKDLRSVRVSHATLFEGFLVEVCVPR